MEENLEQKNIDQQEIEQTVYDQKDVIQDDTDRHETAQHEAKEGYFQYYLFVLLNSIIGFILVLYFSRHLIDLFASKGIVDLRSMKMVVSIVAAATITMLFMMITLTLKKFFKSLFFSEIFLYIYIGGLTTIINIVSWNFFFKLIDKFIVSEQVAWKVAEGIAFVVAVIFAFFADKIIVFKSRSFVPTILFAELGIFISARLVTELINVGLMMFIIDYQKQDPFFGKVVASVVVIVLNYLFSKFVIFRKKAIKHEEQNQ